jgi:nicotinamidase-related amidase
MSVSTTDKGLLTPDNCTVIFIDFQPEMLPEDSSLNENSPAGLLARTAALFSLPVIITVAGGGAAAPWLSSLFPETQVVHRAGINAWDCPKFQGALRQSGRRNLVIASPFAEVSLVLPVLQALTDGYGVYVVEDASSGRSKLARRAAFRRMEQAGAVSLTAVPFLLELQRDWFDGPHRDAVRSFLADQGVRVPSPGSAS